MYDVRWYKQPLVLYVRHEGVLTPDKVVRSEEMLYAFLLETRHTIHIMYDLTQMTGVELNLYDLQRIDIVQRVQNHEHRGWTVSFDRRNPIYTLMSTILSKRGKDRTQFVDNEAEAVGFLRHIDARLAYLQLRQLSHTT